MNSTSLISKSFFFFFNFLLMFGSACSDLFFRGLADWRLFCYDSSPFYIGDGKHVVKKKKKKKPTSKQAPNPRKPSLMPIYPYTVLMMLGETG